MSRKGDDDHNQALVTAKPSIPSTGRPAGGIWVLQCVPPCVAHVPVPYAAASIATVPSRTVTITTASLGDTKLEMIRENKIYFLFKIK